MNIDRKVSIGSKLRPTIDETAVDHFKDLTELFRDELQVSQSSTGWGGNAGKAVDGNDASNSWSHTYNGKNEYLEIDFGQSVSVFEIQLRNRGDSVSSVHQRLNGAQIVLLDENHQQVHRFDAITNADDGSWHTFSLEILTEARYVRVEHKDQYLHIAELKVLGDHDETAVDHFKDLTELFRDELQVSQSSTGWGGNAGKAVDGNDASNSWSHTYNGKNEYLEIDFGQSVSVFEIQLRNRGDSVSSVHQRLNGAQIVLLDENHQQVHRFDAITNAVMVVGIHFLWKY